MIEQPSDSSEWAYEVYDLDTGSEEFGVFQPIIDLWNVKRAERVFPAWADFELSDFVGWYGWVSVCDLTFDPIFDTHYRLWGTQVTNLLKYDLTGRSPRVKNTPPFEYMGGYSQVEMNFLEKIARQPGIGISRGAIVWEERSHVSYHEVTLPLADDGKNVDKLLFVIQPVRLT